MFGFRIVTEREMKYLEQEIEYLRRQLESEEKKVERLMDNLCLTNGTPPVSDTAVTERKDRISNIMKEVAGMRELFADETVDPPEKDVN